MHIAWVLFAFGCGARSEIGGGIVADGDGGVVLFDAAVDVSSSDALDAGSSPCAAPVVIIGDNGARTACKASVTIVCGSTTYRLTGGCDLPDADWPDSDPVGLEALCFVNGNGEPPFTSASCTCDPADWIALAEARCPGPHQ